VNYPFLTQKERDIETNLDYFIARYYSSIQGRFTTVDPRAASAQAGGIGTVILITARYDSPIRLVWWLAITTTRMAIG